MSFDNNTLRRLQMSQLAIMKDIDDFCREHHITYSLYAGSLLGAVRHQGFIPWDDDLDICMPRADYDRFIRLWTEKADPRYLLQNKDNTPAFTQSFTKIRKFDSNFYTDYDKVVSAYGNYYHTGIFVDIFPVDRIPDGAVSRKLFMAELMLYQLMIHEFVPSNTSMPVRIGSSIILNLIPKNMRVNLRRFLLKQIGKHNTNAHMRMVTTETLDAARQIYSNDIFANCIDLPFEDTEFQCIADWDQMLRVKFGDYLQLPPEDDRAWKHLPLEIDFDNSPAGYVR